MWRDALLIMFSCTAINHLGLISAIENAIKHNIPILNCPKCFTFWSVLAYYFITADYTSSLGAFVHGAIGAGAVALLLSYASIWLELLMGIIDKLYNKAYEQIYPATDTAADDQASS